MCRKGEHTLSEQIYAHLDRCSREAAVSATHLCKHHLLQFRVFHELEHRISRVCYKLLKSLSNVPNVLLMLCQLRLKSLVSLFDVMNLPVETFDYVANRYDHS